MSVTEFYHCPFAAQRIADNWNDYDPTGAYAVKPVRINDKVRFQVVDLLAEGGHKEALRWSATFFTKEGGKSIYHFDEMAELHHIAETAYDWGDLDKIVVRYER